MRIIKSNLTKDDRVTVEKMNADIITASEAVDVLLDFAAETTMELCMMELGLEGDSYDNL